MQYDLKYITELKFVQSFIFNLSVIFCKARRSDNSNTLDKKCIFVKFNFLMCRINILNDKYFLINSLRKNSKEIKQNH